MKQTVLFFALFILSCFSLNGQQASFQVALNLPTETTSYHSVFPRNGGIVTVSQFSTSSLPDGLRFTRHDNAGELVWVRAYQNQRYDYMFLTRLIPTYDGGYIASLVGQFLSNSPSEAVLIRLDSSGSVLWEKYYQAPDAPNYEVGAQVHVAEAADSSLYLTFNQNSITSLDFYTVLLHLTPTGNVIWSKMLDELNMLVNSIDASGVNRVNLAVSFSLADMITFDSLGQFVDAKGYYDALGNNLILRDWDVRSSGVPKAILFSTYVGNSILVRLDSMGGIVSSQEATGVFSRLLKPVQNDYVTTGSVLSDSSFVLYGWQQNTFGSNAFQYQTLQANTSITNFKSMPDNSILFFVTDYNWQASPPNWIVKTQPAVNSIIPSNGCNIVADSVLIQPVQIYDSSFVFTTTIKQTFCDTLSVLELSDEITVTIDCQQVSVAETEMDESIQVYPNPASDYILVQGNFGNDARLNCYSSSGNLIMTITSQNAHGGFKVNARNLPEGLYFIKVVSENRNESTARVVISH